jgi:hypothetical protein
MAKETFTRVGGFYEGFDDGCAFEDDDFIEQVRYCGVPVFNLDIAITVHQAHGTVPLDGMRERLDRNAGVLAERRRGRAAGTVPKGEK